jgi:hypothetical protein
MNLYMMLILKSVHMFKIFLKKFFFYHCARLILLKLNSCKYYFGCLIFLSLYWYKNVYYGIFYKTCFIISLYAEDSIAGTSRVITNTDDVQIRLKCAPYHVRNFTGERVSILYSTRDQNDVCEDLIEEQIR